MIKQIGSQLREIIEESGYVLVHRGDDGEVVLQPTWEDGYASGPQEIWFESDDNAGYTVEIDGVGYEFARTAVIQFPFRQLAA